MSLKKTIQAITIVAAIGGAVPAFAQSTGAPTQSGHDMPGMDMQTMMKQCAQMRQQMQPGARMTPDMQTMMRQCDEMDRQMGGTAGNPAAPRTRTR